MEQQQVKSGPSHAYRNWKTDDDNNHHTVRPIYDYTREGKTFFFVVTCMAGKNTNKGKMQFKEILTTVAVTAAAAAAVINIYSLNTFNNLPKHIPLINVLIKGTI